MNGWMDESATALFSYFFTKWPFRHLLSQHVSATSSLNTFLSTSSLTIFFSAFQLVSSSVASPTQFFSSRSYCNAFSNLELQSRLPRVATSLMLYCPVSCCYCVSTARTPPHPGLPWKQRCDARSQQLSVKTTGFATESVFTREFTRFRTVTVPGYLMMELT